MPRELSITELARQRQREECLAQAEVAVNYNAQPSIRGRIQKSMGLSCHPSQVAEFNENARKQGLTAVSFDKDGTCRMPSFGKQRTQYMQFRGVFDKDGSY